MRFHEINPFIRFAERFPYHSPGRRVRVADCRIFYILEGSGQINTADSRYPLLTGSLFFCRENSVYSFSAEEITLISLNFDLRWSETAAVTFFPPRPADPSRDGSPGDDSQPDGSAKGGSPSDSAPPDGSPQDSSPPDVITDGGENFLNSCLHRENGEPYLPALEEILAEFSEKNSFFREKSGSILKGLLTDLARDVPSPSGRSSDVLRRTVSYIREHYREPLDNRQLAAWAGYHEYHLNRLFLRYTGKSLHQYILSCRLNEAKRLLLSTSLPLSEIAERTGFCSGAHFSSCFKKENGISPRQYRSQFRGSI